MPLDILAILDRVVGDDIPVSDAQGVILFSGGLDSVALAILAKRQGYDLQPVYASHRANVGNVTKKEVTVATRLAPLVTGRKLWILKPRKKGREASWVQRVDRVIYTDKLPVTKQRKSWRNRIMLDVLADLGLCDGPVALGLWEGRVGDHNRHRADDITPSALRRYLRKKRCKGRLLVPADFDADIKADLIRAVGRRGRNPEYLYASDSCLMYFNTPCGNCWSCKDRAQAFVEAWGEDRTPYRPKSWAGRFVRR